ncbi:MAG TPA: hypothetical protein VMS96_06530 [Terriglobales bacterium]|nr:hypothetical protein [Terriglobales bacterium]
MNYLDPSEYETYGLEKAVPAAFVAAASSLIDAHCRRETLGVAQYVERLRLGGRGGCRLSFLPLAPLAPATSPLVNVRARYGVPRDPDELGLQVAGAFGLPGTWTDLDPAQVEFDAATGELAFPPNALGLAFNEVEVTYTGGLDPIPEPVKHACAQIVRNALAAPALNVRAGSIDRMRLDYFADTLLDDTVRAQLAPYVAQKL